MALALEDGVLVWQKVAKALAAANPANTAAFYRLKDYLVTQGGNPQLQFYPITAAQMVAADTNLTGAACTVYGFYAKAARTSGTTSAFIDLHAAATSDATTTTIFTQRFKAAGQSVAAVYPTGLASETGLTIVAATAVGGDTAVSAADAANGFVIVGA